MTLERLRIFVAVAERDHVTAAARALNLTQSAVSNALAALEAEQVQINALLNGSELYSQGAARIAEVTERGGQIDADLLVLMERWEALEAK